MRRDIATTLAVASLVTVFTAPAAQALPAQVSVRIEGKSQTLFEGPILTDGHDIEASSDTKRRECDGVNGHDPKTLTPGPTPTSAAADAMSLIGETFDGKWYPGYEDYLITRWGPDHEMGGEAWGVLVNNVLTNIGGCQYELDTGDEVLWAYDAFAHKPLLALYPAGDPSGARPLTATAELNKPFTVEVVSYGNDQEGEPPLAPERAGSTPYAGADVSPVQTSIRGFETVVTTDPETVTTDAEGKASITFTEPGWHRIKATAVNEAGKEDAIRSNRLDVCVPAEDAEDCPDPWSEDQVRTPPPTPEPEDEPEAAPTPADNTNSSASTAQEPLTASLTTPVLTTALSSGGLSASASVTHGTMRLLAKHHRRVRCVRQRNRAAHSAARRRTARVCKHTVAHPRRPRRARRHGR